MPIKGTQIVFAGGVDESVDDKIREAGMLKTARNVVYNYDGLLEKRHGFDNVSLSAFDYEGNSTANISPNHILSINNELLAVANGQWYSALSGGGFIQRDRHIPMLVDSMHSSASGGRIASYDIAYCNGYRVMAWCTRIAASNTPLMYVKTIEDATSVVLHDSIRLGSPAAVYSCRTVVLGTSVVCMYYAAGTLYGSVLDLSSAAPQWGAEQTVATGLDTTYIHGTWDAREIEGSSSVMSVVYYTTAGGTNKVGAMSVSLSGGTLTAGTVTYQNLANVATDVATGIGIRASLADDRVYAAVGVYDGTANTTVATVRWSTPAGTPVAVSGFTGSAAITVAGSYRVRAAVSRIAANDILVCACTIGTSSPVNAADLWFARTTDFTSATPSQFKLTGYELVGRTFETSGGRHIVPARFVSSSDGTHVLLDAGVPYPASGTTANTFPGYHQARAYPRLAPTSMPVSQVASTPTYSTDKFFWGTTVGLTEDARADLHTSVVTLNPPEGISSKPMGGILYCAGGYPIAYDGTRVIELGYDYPPPDVTTTNVGSGGSMANGAYQWAAHYEWLDGKGKIHRSPVTYSASTNIASATGAAGSCNITVRPVVLTQRSDQEAREPRVYVALYRTAANSTDSYTRLYEGAVANVFCEATQANIAYQDTATDASIASNEALYTDGDLLEPQGAPASIALCAHQGRIFGISHDGTIWYSNEAVDEEPVSYNDAQTIAEFEGGMALALASLDNALLVLKRSSVWAILGEGPDNTGSGAGFSKPVRIASDVGVKDWRSVLETPKGVMFYGTKGLYLVNRAKEVVWIGKRVRKTLESYPVVTNAVLHPTGRWAMFSCKASETSSSGLILCYDLERDAWTTWDITVGPSPFTTLRAPKSMAATANNLYILTPDNVLKSNSSNYRDNGVWVTMNIETGQVKTDLQGYALLRRFWILGTRSASAGLNVQVARNFNSTYDTFVASYTDAQLLALERDQWRVSPENKKGMSFQLKLTDFDPSTGNGQGLKIQGITADLVPISDKFQLTANGAQR